MLCHVLLEKPTRAHGIAIQVGMLEHVIARQSRILVEPLQPGYELGLVLICCQPASSGSLSSSLNTLSSWRPLLSRLTTCIFRLAVYPVIFRLGVTRQRGL